MQTLSQTIRFTAAHARVLNSAAELLKEKALQRVEFTPSDLAAIHEIAHLVHDAGRSLDVASGAPAIREAFGFPFSVEHTDGVPIISAGATL